MEALARNVDPAFDSSSLYAFDPTAPCDCSKAERVVLLWPDASGIGWSRVEKAFFSRIDPRTKLVVLNGRRRLFELTRTRWYVWRLRRLLDKWFIGDAIAFFLILIVTPPLAAIDRLNGRT
jgi:hypothetical protein